MGLSRYMGNLGMLSALINVANICNIDSVRPTAKLGIKSTPPFLAIAFTTSASWSKGAVDYRRLTQALINQVEEAVLVAT